MIFKINLLSKGKTCLGIRCVTGEFPVIYIPTVCGWYLLLNLSNQLAEINYQTDNYQVDDRDYGPFSVWDTAGHEDYPRFSEDYIFYFIFFL